MTTSRSGRDARHYGVARTEKRYAPFTQQNYPVDDRQDAEFVRHNHDRRTLRLQPAERGDQLSVALGIEMRALGSSSTSIEGTPNAARASATRCASPADNPRPPDCSL